MSESRAIGKSINHVAKKNGIKISWRVKGGDLMIAVEDTNLIKMIGIVNMMGFVGIADLHPEHGMSSIWIKG